MFRMSPHSRNTTPAGWARHASNRPVSFTAGSTGFCSSTLIMGWRMAVPPFPPPTGQAHDPQRPMAARKMQKNPLSLCYHGTEDFFNA